MAGVIDDPLYFRHISNYIKPLVKKITHQTLCTKDFTFCQKQWKHVENVLICLNFETEFNPLSQNGTKSSLKNQSSVFDFTKFYEEKKSA